MKLKNKNKKKHVFRTVEWCLTRFILCHSMNRLPLNEDIRITRMRDYNRNQYFVTTKKNNNDTAAILLARTELTMRRVIDQIFQIEPCFKRTDSQLTISTDESSLLSYKVLYPCQVVLPTKIPNFSFGRQDVFAVLLQVNGCWTDFDRYIATIF